jgi:hypothetical protein
MNACLKPFCCSLQLLGRRRLIEIKNAGYNTKLSAPLDNVPFSTRIERDRIEDSVRKIAYNAEFFFILFILVICFLVPYDFRFYMIVAYNELSTGVQKSFGLLCCCKDPIIIPSSYTSRDSICRYVLGNNL